MKYYFKRKIGKETHTFVSEGENLFDMIQDSKKISFNSIHKCGCCGGDNLTLDSHIAQGKHKYVYVRCLNPQCRATLNFGKQQENPDVFYPRTREEDGKKVLDWKKFEPKSE